MRIERVVEIEHPGLDMGEAARFGSSGSRHRERSLAKPHSRTSAARQLDGGEAAGGRSLAGAIAVIVELELDVTCAQQHGAAPAERLFGPFDGVAVAVDGLGEAVEAARLAGQIGLEALPDSIRYQPRVTTRPF